MRMEVGVPRGRGQYSWLNFHVNPHLRLIDIMWSTRVFILSLTSDVTEINGLKVKCEA
jgi:ribosomal protein S10